MLEATKYQNPFFKKKKKMQIETIFMNFNKQLQNIFDATVCP